MVAIDDKRYHGCSPDKKRCYCGVLVHLIAAAAGQPVEFPLSVGRPVFDLSC